MCREQNFTRYTELLICKATHCYCEIINTHEDLRWKEAGRKDIGHSAPTLFLRHTLDKVKQIDD